MGLSMFSLQIRTFVNIWKHSSNARNLQVICKCFRKTLKTFLNLQRSSGHSICKQSDHWPFLLVFRGRSWAFHGCFGTLQGIPGCSKTLQGVAGLTDTPDVGCLSQLFYSQFTNFKALLCSFVRAFFLSTTNKRHFQRNVPNKKQLRQQFYTKEVARPSDLDAGFKFLRSLTASWVHFLVDPVQNSSAMLVNSQLVYTFISFSPIIIISDQVTHLIKLTE